MEVYNRIKNDIFLFCFVYLIISFAWSNLPIMRDSTDGEDRSGMELRIDAKTGCHYLEGIRGGITPRLTNTGEHICSLNITSKQP